MSVITAIPKAAVSFGLTAVRTPADIVIGVAGDRPSTTAAGAAIDRADAAVRGAAGTVLRDAT